MAKKRDIPDEEELFELAEFFKTFGDTTRIKILYALSNEEMCVGDIATQIGVSQTALSHQLRILKAAKIVRIRRDGKNSYYSLDDDHVKKIIDIGMEHMEEMI